MRFHSLKGHPKNVCFREALLASLAPDKGLYFPLEIPKLTTDFVSHAHKHSRISVALELIYPFLEGEINKKDLAIILEDTLSFDFPLVRLDDSTSILELFHGPTMAFKDLGARFMARCLQYFTRENKEKTKTVLVATSGDTGGAVASGFLGVEGVRVIILFPKGKVSQLQEKQLTTFGENIYALEVDGTFDHCQSIVKDAFLEKEIKDAHQLISANSINVARWLPQMFYYAFTLLSLRGNDTVFSVPSGNFGNLCAGMMCSEMGLKAKHFIASTNANRTVTDYMETEKYSARPSIATLSNAMDVGNPSNFVRIQKLFGSYNNLKTNLSAFSFEDQATLSCMQNVYQRYDYVLDPHAAVGFLGMDVFRRNNDAQDKNQYVVLETAHPLKFNDTVQRAIHKSLPMSDDLKSLMNSERRQTHTMNADWDSFLMALDQIAKE